MSLPERFLPAIVDACDSTARRLIRCRLGRFRADQRGASAVEFALVAVPFLSLTCGTIEASIDYWAQAILQQAVADAGRLIYTGKFQANNANTTGSADLITIFRNEICKENGFPRVTIFNCSNVKINISQVDDFSTAQLVSPSITNPSTGVSDWNPAYGNYSCGKGNSIMIIQAAVDFPVFFNFLGTGASALPGGKRILQAATVFRSEPFGSGATC